MLNKGNAVCRVLWLNTESLLPYFTQLDNKTSTYKLLAVNKYLWCKNMLYLKAIAKGAISSVCITAAVMYAPIN